MTKIKCIKTGGLEELTLNKEYEVIAEDMSWYRIMNDNGLKDGYQKHLFEEVKEFKEYTVQEVLKMPKGTILKLFPYDESEKEIVVSEGIAGNKYLYYIDDDGCTNEAVIISSWIMDKPRFKIIKEIAPVNFLTAWESIEEGKIIESTYTLDRYKIIDGLIRIQHQGGEFEKCGNIATTEIGNTWIIID